MKGWREMVTADGCKDHVTLLIASGTSETAHCETCLMYVPLITWLCSPHRSTFDAFLKSAMDPGHHDNVTKLCANVILGSPGPWGF